MSLLPDIFLRLASLMLRVCKATRFFLAVVVLVGRLPRLQRYSRGRPSSFSTCLANETIVSKTLLT